MPKPKTAAATAPASATDLAEAAVAGLKPDGKGRVTLGNLVFRFDLDRVEALETALGGRNAFEYVSVGVPPLSMLRAAVAAGARGSDGAAVVFPGALKKHGLMRLHAAALSALTVGLQDLGYLVGLEADEPAEDEAEDAPGEAEGGDAG